MKRITFYKDGKDISDDIELKNGRANPFGWSQYEIWHHEKRVGWLESGSPMSLTEGYSFLESEEPERSTTPTPEENACRHGIRPDICGQCSAVRNASTDVLSEEKDCDCKNNFEGVCYHSIVAPPSHTSDWNGDTELEELFNQAVKACIRFIKGEITEEERTTILSALNSEAEDVISQVKSEAYNRGKAEKVAEVRKQIQDVLDFIPGAEHDDISIETLNYIKGLKYPLSLPSLDV